MNTIRAILLKRFRLHHNISIPKEHVLNQSYREACTNDLVRGIELQLYGRETEATRKITFVSLYPSNWWEHLKQEKAPQWFLKKWPVRITKKEFCEEVVFKAQVFFPEVEGVEEYKVVYIGKLL